LNAYVVVDLAFGDSGKGLLTDFLVRRTGAGVVVRYNGGAQAGHNVVTAEGAHHTFSQFGSGSFVPGVRTILSRHVVIHPTALLVEAESLRRKDLPDIFARLSISDRALMISPFHQAAGRIRELLRGAARHGSCGVGVGETVKDAIEFPEDALRAGDLRDAPMLRRRLRRIRDRKRDEFLAAAAGTRDEACFADELAVFERDSIVDAWVDAASWLATLGVVVPDATIAVHLAQEETVVFEGAQGVLLDEWFGFHPFTSWSNCTADNARELLAECAPDAAVRRIGVLRACAARHGPGPFPTETHEFRSAIFDHNCKNDWQGTVRYGWFDAVLAKYAIEAVGFIDSLAITHLDGAARMPDWKACTGYRLDVRPDEAEYVGETTVDGIVTRLRALPRRAGVVQPGIADLLARAEPVVAEYGRTEGGVVSALESLLGRSVNFVSRGPRAADVSWLGDMAGPGCP